MQYTPVVQARVQERRAAGVHTKAVRCGCVSESARLPKRSHAGTRSLGHARVAGGVWAKVIQIRGGWLKRLAYQLAKHLMSRTPLFGNLNWPAVADPLHSVPSPPDRLDTFAWIQF